MLNVSDGRVQDPVIAYLKKRFAVEYVGNITAEGAVSILSHGLDTQPGNRLLRLLDWSIEQDSPKRVGIVADHDCQGNPAPKHTQLAQLRMARRRIEEVYPGLKAMVLWVDENQCVEEIPAG